MGGKGRIPSDIIRKALRDDPEDPFIWAYENKCRILFDRLASRAGAMALKIGLWTYLSQPLKNKIAQSIRGQVADHIIQNFDLLHHLPFTVDELIEHMESRFQPGMWWGNHGEWHIDHIVPKSHFKFKEIGDVVFLKCWSLENLQPLWAKDNLRKHTKLEAPNGQ